MSPRRLLLILGLALGLFLGLFTFNQRSGSLDSLGANSGLEFAGAINRLFRSLGDSAGGIFHHYINLVDVQQENDQLREQINLMRIERASLLEDRAEVTRLRELLNLDYQPQWPVLAARVLAGRMGSNSALESIILSRGYLTGARPGTPIVSYDGLVGRVYKAGPGTSLALLITDPGSQVAVVSSQSRVQGILSGGGAEGPMELRFVRQNSHVDPGEILLTSGVDAAYPKGIPVARVLPASGQDAAQSQLALALADFQRMEEVLLLERPDAWRLPSPSPVYTRRPPQLAAPDFDWSLITIQDNLEQLRRLEAGENVDDVVFLYDQDDEAPDLGLEAEGE